MNKKTVYLLGILLTILLGTYFYWKLCCNADCCGNENDNKNQVTTHSEKNANALYPFKFNDGSFSISSDDNFNYKTSGFDFLKPLSGEVSGQIEKLKLYLNENNAKSVTVTGLYSSNEENNSNFANLGLARANDVKKYFVSKGIPSNRIKLASKLDDSLVLEDPIRGPIVYNPGNMGTPSSFPFQFSDGDFSVNVSDNFNYTNSGFNFIEPLSASVDGGVENLKTYLAKNADKALDITGLYTSDEKNTSAFPNLGLARANDVKNYLIAKDIPSSRINLYGRLDDAIVPHDSIFKGPLLYRIKTGDTSSKDKEKMDLEQLHEKIQANPLVLYFNTAQASINLTVAQRRKIADISRYLDKVAGAKTIVVGHTDNQGNSKANMSLGQRRANFAKNYLSKNGIPAKKIDAISKGETQPIESNETENGRAKNRRTVITIN